MLLIAGITDYDLTKVCIAIWNKQREILQKVEANLLSPANCFCNSLSLKYITFIFSVIYNVEYFGDFRYVFLERFEYAAVQIIKTGINVPKPIGDLLVGCQYAHHASAEVSNRARYPLQGTRSILYLNGHLNPSFTDAGQRY